MSMGLKEDLKSDLTLSMKARDAVRSMTIRALLTAITNEEVAGKEARTLSDAEIVTVIAREAKKRRESAEAFDAAGSKDRADAERAEGEIIAHYLPAQLSDDEIKAMIQDAITQTGASGPSGMGQVMKIIAPKISGRADGGVVSQLVKEALA